MPSQAAIDIASIFDNVITNNLRYCCVCLRTEEERKLVEPVHFMKCLQIMSVQLPVESICYVCEAESTRAYALFQAMNFASVINQWFRNMASKLKYKSEMPTYLDKHIAKQGRFAGRWPLPEWWRRIRARGDLVQTEVLLVGDSPEEVHFVTTELSQTQPAPGRPPPAKATRATDPVMDSIVIIDDEEDPLDIRSPPPLQPAPKAKPLLPPAPKVIPAPPPERSTLKMVPYDRLPENTNNLILPNDNMIITQNTDTNISGYILQQLMLGPDGNYHIVPNGPTIQDLDRSVETALKRLETNESMSNVSISQVRTVEDGGGGDDGEKEGAVKRPVMSGRIDWEDKIPMDVISFVDATDPMIHKDSTSRETPKRPRIPRNQNGSVIDLC